MKTFLIKFEGSIYLLLVIAIWVLSALLIRSIFNSDETKFDKPLFLTYFSTTFFTLYLIPTIYQFIRKKYNANKYL
jgi:solute carrier family 35 protein F5